MLLDIIIQTCHEPESLVGDISVVAFTASLNKIPKVANIEHGIKRTSNQHWMTVAQAF